MKTIALLFLLASSSFTAAQSTAPSAKVRSVAQANGSPCRLSAADAKEVSAIPGHYREAWFQADATSAVMKLFTEDASILPAHGTAPIHGQKSIIRFWWPPTTRPFELKQFTMTPQRTSGCGQVAVVSGLQTLVWKYKDEEKSTFQEGTFLMVFHKQPDGRWLIESFMWDDKPYVTK